MTDYMKLSNDTYEYIVDADRAHEVLSSVDEAALDIETTSLQPEDGEIRLIQITNDDVHVVIDLYCVGPLEDFIHHFTRPSTRWWVYNAKFETKWFDYFDDEQASDIMDVDFARKAVMGGSPTSLAKLVKMDLKFDMSKEQQKSDWSVLGLTNEQLNYAALDSYVTWELKKMWWDGRCDDGQKHGAMMINSSVRATITSEKYGLVLDPVYHAQVVKIWEMKHGTFTRFLRRYVSERTIPNLRSKLQISNFLKAELPQAMIDVWPKTEKTGQLQTTAMTLKDASRKLPYPMSRWLAALAGFNYYEKYLSTYGMKLVNHQLTKGYIPTRTNIAQAKTCRESSSQENLQNIPRQIYIRRAFSIGTPSIELAQHIDSPIVGTKVMTLADYAGVEVRVLAEVSGDAQLLEDCIYGDVHGASAAQIYGYEVDYVIKVLESKGLDPKYANIYPTIKAQRGMSKGFTFQLTYGAGNEALSFVLRCTVEEAEEAVQAWASRYRKAYDYRFLMYDDMVSTGYLNVCDGRTIYVPKAARAMPIAANYPIQAGAATVMYRAKYHCHRLFYAQRKRFHSYVAASVHDELLGYADRDYAEEAMALQLEAMELAWLDVFPNSNTDNLTDHAIGLSWAAKP